MTTRTKPIPTDAEIAEAAELSDLLKLTVPPLLVAIARGALEKGLREKYPMCCIVQFIADCFELADDRPMRANREPHPMTQHIMCDQCQAKLDRVWPDRPKLPQPGALRKLR